MKKAWNQGIAWAVLAGALCALPLHVSAGEAEQKAANELLDASHFNKMMDDSINASIQMIVQADPSMASHEETLRKFYQKHMSGDRLRADMVKLYADVFTAKELNDITAFYKTSTGQKALQKLPEVMRGAMQLAQRHVMDNMEELQSMLEKDAPAPGAADQTADEATEHEAEELPQP